MKVFTEEEFNRLKRQLPLLGSCPRHLFIKSPHNEDYSICLKCGDIKPVEVVNKYFYGQI